MFIERKHNFLIYYTFGADKLCLSQKNCDFFNNKIDKIREVVDSAILSDNLSPYLSSNHSTCSMSTACVNKSASI